MGGRCHATDRANAVGYLVKFLSNYIFYKGCAKNDDFIMPTFSVQPDFETSSSIFNKWPYCGSAMLAALAVAKYCATIGCCAQFWPRTEGAIAANGSRIRSRGLVKFLSKYKLIIGQAKKKRLA